MYEGTRYETSKILERQTFEIRPKTLWIRRRGLLDSVEYEIPFENIGYSKVIGTFVHNSAFVIAFFSVSLALVMLVFKTIPGAVVFLVAAIISLTYGMLTRVSSVTIPIFNGDDLSINYGRRQKEEAVGFSDKLLGDVKKFMKAKYTHFDKQMPLERQLANLEFLWEQNLISEKEYNDYKKFLMDPNRPNIGFVN